MKGDLNKINRNTMKFTFISSAESRAIGCSWSRMTGNAGEEEDAAHELVVRVRIAVQKTREEELHPSMKQVDLVAEKQMSHNSNHRLAGCAEKKMTVAIYRVTNDRTDRHGPKALSLGVENLYMRLSLL